MEEKLFITQLFLVNGLVALAFFFFNTQMHERYLQPSILFFGIAAVLRPKKIMILIYALVSLAFVLNLEKVIKYFNFPSYDTVQFSSRFIALIFLIVIVLGIYSLYKISPVKEDVQLIKTKLLVVFRNFRKSRD